jgi:hypothetical protein
LAKSEQQRSEHNVNIYPNTIKYKLMKNWMLSTILIASVIFPSSHPASASTDGIIDINYSVIPKTIEKGKSLLLNVSVTNTGKSMIENFNIDIVSSGFRLLDEKEFPAKIYPNSTVHKQYALEATDMGKHDIYSNWVYDIPFSSNNSLVTQFSNTSRIREIDVVQPSLEIEFSSLWAVTISTLIGLTAGALITRLGEKFKEKDNQRKERIRNINKIKSMIRYDLNKYKLDLENDNWEDKPEFWKYLVNEGLYQYLAENQILEKEVADFHTKVLGTSGTAPERTNKMRMELISRISRIEEILNDWRV